MKSITIVMPVSRNLYLQRVFSSLEMLDCARSHTRLLVFVDGDPELFLVARNLTEQSKFAERLCVQGKVPGQRREFSINTRRRRIAAAHNAMRELVQPCDYVFLVEDDSIPGPDALKRLLSGYLAHPHAGFITGVQVGRWGVPHLGLWTVDDPYEPTQIISLMPGEGLQEVDASGLYACLTKYEHYAGHEFKPFGNCDLGPDVQFSLALRQQGYKNFVAWDVSVEHRTSDGRSLTPFNTTLVRMRFTKHGDAWSGTVIEA